MTIKTYFYKLNLHVYDKIGQKHDFLKSKTKYLETMRYTNDMVEYDILDQSIDLLKLSHIRVFNFTRWIWHYYALRYFFLKCKIVFSAKFCLLITETFKFAPLVLFFSYKFDQQYLIGWTAGYYSNKFRIHRYVQERGLDHLYNFTITPGLVVFLGFFLKRTEKALAELMSWLGDSFIVSLTSLYDNYNFFFYNILTSKTDLKIYFFLQLLFTLININQKNIVFYPKYPIKPNKFLSALRKKVKTSFFYVRVSNNNKKVVVVYQKISKKMGQNWEKDYLSRKKLKKNERAKIVSLNKIDLKTKIKDNRYCQKVYNFRKPKRIFFILKKRCGKTSKLYKLFKKSYQRRPVVIKNRKFFFMNLNQKNRISSLQKYESLKCRTYLFKKQYISKLKYTRILKSLIKNTKIFGKNRKFLSQKSKINLLKNRVLLKTFQHKQSKGLTSAIIKNANKDSTKFINSDKLNKLLLGKGSLKKRMRSGVLFTQTTTTTKNPISYGVSWNGQTKRGFSTSQEKTTSVEPSTPDTVFSDSIQSSVVTIETESDILPTQSDTSASAIDEGSLPIVVDDNYISKILEKHFASKTSIPYKYTDITCKILPHSFVFKGHIFYFSCASLDDLKRFLAKTWNPPGEFKRSHQKGYPALRVPFGVEKNKIERRNISKRVYQSMIDYKQKTDNKSTSVTSKGRSVANAAIVANKIAQAPVVVEEKSVKCVEGTPTTTLISKQQIIEQELTNLIWKSGKTKLKDQKVSSKKWQEEGDLTYYFTSRKFSFSYEYVQKRKIRVHQFVDAYYKYFLACIGPKNLARITSPKWTPAAEFNRGIQKGYIVERYKLPTKGVTPVKNFEKK